MKVFVDNQSLLDEAVDRLQNESVLGLDTEFVRRNTYFPILSLVMIGTEDYVALVDYKVKFKLDGLRQILSNRNILKVIHAPYEDNTILLNRMGFIPSPMFDTQLAAMFTGYDASPPYAMLVREFLGFEMDKSQQDSAWLKRPLTERQLNYAELDVKFLPELHNLLSEKLKSLGRYEWFQEDNIRLQDKSIYEINADKAYGKIKAGRLKPQEKFILKEIAYLREKIAMQRNIPKQWLIADSKLVDIAAKKPRSINELQSIGLSEEQIAKLGEPILHAIESSFSMDSSGFPKDIPITQSQSAEVVRLREKITALAAKVGIKPSLIAPTNEITNYIKNPSSSLLSQGWRRELTASLV